MRIVSWNQRGQKGITTGHWETMLSSVDADVIVLQECSSAPSATGWKFVVYGTGPDRYALGVRTGVEVKYSMLMDDPRGDDVHNTRKYLVAKVKDGNQSFILATCHAPHGGGSCTTSSNDTMEYMASLAEAFSGTDIKRSDTYINLDLRSADSGGGVKLADKPVRVDIFLGDTNLYEPLWQSDCWPPNNWTDLPLGATTQGKSGSPLDRITVRPDQRLHVNNIRHGRIMPPGKKPPRGGLTPNDFTPSGNNTNEYSRSTDARERWGCSDHFPIMIDTAPGTNRPSQEEKVARSLADPGTMALRSRGIKRKADENPDETPEVKRQKIDKETPE